MEQLTNFEKLRAEIQKMKQSETDKKKQLAYYIKTQIENLASIKGFVQNNLENLEKVQTSIINVKQITKENETSNRIDKEKISKLIIVNKNLTKVLQGIENFINISKKIEELKQLIKDEENYLTIQKNLENLMELKKSLQKSQQNSESLQQFMRKFQSVDEFRSEFEALIKTQFYKILDNPKLNAHKLQQNQEIIKRICGYHINDPQFINNYQQYMNVFIEGRFQSKTSQFKDINQILDNITFCIDDLIFFFDNKNQFEDEHKVDFYIQQCYKKQIEDKILPYIKDLSFLKENPGTLVNLMNWLNSYEKLLTKINFEIDGFKQLREIIKSNIGIYHNHISEVFKKFLDRIAQNDDYIFTAETQFEKLDTPTPEDVASFLNQQIDFMGMHLEGEMFANLFSVWLNQLQGFVYDYVIQKE